jgi:hypothetical protein
MVVTLWVVQALTHEGEVAKGRQPILAKLKAVVQMYAGFGKATYTVDQVDCQPLGLVRNNI